MPTENTNKSLRDIIRNLWGRLTDEEIETCEEQRDVFFLAVRRKHGLARAQAQLLLNDLLYTSNNCNV